MRHIFVKHPLKSGAAGGHLPRQGVPPPSPPSRHLRPTTPPLRLQCHNPPCNICGFFEGGANLPHRRAAGASPGVIETKGRGGRGIHIRGVDSSENGGGFAGSKTGAPFSLALVRFRYLFFKIPAAENSALLHASYLLQREL